MTTTLADQDASPARARIPGTRTLVLSLIALCLSELLVVMDNTIVNVAIPTFGRELSASTTQLQWIVDAYTLAFASLLLPAGCLGDRLGRKRILLAGLVGFGGFSVVSALVTTLSHITAMRTLLGVAAAMIFPATLSLITTTFHGSRLKGMAVGIWAATSGIGIALGPILGGLLLKHYSWPSIFWINLPIAAVSIAAVALVVPESRSRLSGHFDILGALASVSAVAFLVWAIIEGPHKGWTSAPVLIAFAVSVVAFIGLVWWGLVCKAPLIDMKLFRRREFSAGALAISIAFFGLFGFIFVITVFFQAIRGYSALGAGVATLPFAVVMASLSPFATMLARRIGAGWVVGGGLAVMASGFYIVTTVAADCSYWGAVVPAMSLMAAGLAMVQGPATDALMDTAPLARAGSASATNDTTREVGGTLGVAVLGSVVASVFSSRLTDLLASLHLPAQILEPAKSSAMAAMAVADQVPAQVAGPLRAATSSAFMSALHQASWVAVGVAACGAVVALVTLPRRRAA